MTTIHHLIISQHELDLISAAARSLDRLSELGAALGAPANEVREQVALLKAIAQRLYFDSGGIKLTPDPDAEPVAA